MSSALAFSGLVHLCLRAARERPNLLLSSLTKQPSPPFSFFSCGSGISPKLELSPFQSQRPPKFSPKQRTVGCSVSQAVPRAVWQPQTALDSNSRVSFSRPTCKTTLAPNGYEVWVHNPVSQHHAAFQHEVCLPEGRIECLRKIPVVNLLLFLAEHLG